MKKGSVPMQRYSKELREQAFLLSSEVAEQAGINKETLQRVEAGTYKLTDKMNIRLMRVIIPHLNSVPTKNSNNNSSYQVKEDAVYVSEESDGNYEGSSTSQLTQAIYSQFSTATQETISLLELDIMVKKAQQ